MLCFMYGLLNQSNLIKAIIIMFRGSSVQKVLCSEGHLFKRSYVQKVLRSEHPLFRRIYKIIQKVPFLEGPICSEFPLLTPGARKRQCEKHRNTKSSARRWQRRDHSVIRKLWCKPQHTMQCKTCHKKLRKKRQKTRCKFY